MVHASKPGSRGDDGRNARQGDTTSQAGRIQPLLPPFSLSILQLLEPTMSMRPGFPPLTLFTTLARDERLLRKFFAGSLLDKGNLTLREREIVIDRTTALCGADYEWRVHVALFGARANFSEEELSALRAEGAQSDCWSSSERILIEICDELHDTSSVSDESWQRLRVAYREEACIELIMLVGYYHMVSFLTNALKLPIEVHADLVPPFRREQVGDSRSAEHVRKVQAQPGEQNDPRA